jgi:predicted MPP superfamily phosphohydrolase
MRSFFPVIFSLIFILVVGALELIFLRLLNKTWWDTRWIRRAAWSLPLVGIAAVLLWGIGAYNSIDWLSSSAAAFVILAFVLEAALMLSLPISGLIHLAHRIIDRILARRQAPPEPHIDRQRRLILKSAAAALPVITISSGAFGVGRAFASARVYEREMHFPHLPPEMDGLRVLHLSDLHLRHYVTLSDLENVLSDAAEYEPDLVAVTGDVADDLAQLPDALRMISELKAPLGTFATLGNHEYFRGVNDVRRIFDKSPVPLFINEGTAISVNGSRIFLGGIDDPRRMGAKDHAFFQRTIDQTLQFDGGEDFHILMSHRPDALDYASEVGIDLTLAGHTHGGQIGFGDRSAFERVWPDRYLWGVYERRDSQLYTTSGMGHWFPFRLGCPPEAPVIILRRA